MNNIWEMRRSCTELARAQSDYRTPYVRDRARIIHSASFRRLQAKTQVLGIGEGDFHRTRLTHSMEVAQLARGIVRFLSEQNGAKWHIHLPGANLIESIGLAHDLGHPPFGHGGEIALNFVMKDAGGFEGNGQTIRILSRLEAHTEGYGLDLTRRTFLGLLKYPVNYKDVVCSGSPNIPQQLIQLKRKEWKPPKCYLDTEQDVIEWVLEGFSSDDKKLLKSLKQKPTEQEHGKSKYHSFDTSIMELADDIAYGVHDFEDAIALRMLEEKDWDELSKGIDVIWAKKVGLDNLKQVCKDLFGVSGAPRKRAIGQLVNAFIVSVEVKTNNDFINPLLTYSAELEHPAREFLDKFQNLVIKKVIKAPQVQTLEYRGQQLILNLFNALSTDPENLLKDSYKMMIESCTSEVEKQRILCDYIAGMTDEYATRMYERLFVPRHGQFSDKF